jgi:hypothetical protein
MAAPAHGRGSYRADEIATVLLTAVTGFRAARREGQRLTGGASPTVGHTGYWGCGAFGGNRVLMAVLQLLAVAEADVDALAFHPADARGRDQLEHARAIVAELESAGSEWPTSKLIARLTALRFEWGVGDGN